MIRDASCDFYQNILYHLSVCADEDGIIVLVEFQSSRKAMRHARKMFLDVGSQPRWDDFSCAKQTRMIQSTKHKDIRCNQVKQKE